MLLRGIFVVELRLESAIPLAVHVTARNPPEAWKGVTGVISPVDAVAGVVPVGDNDHRLLSPLTATRPAHSRLRRGGAAVSLLHLPRWYMRRPPCEH